MSRERALALFLRLYAFILLPAVVAALLPTSWLAVAYAWLGLGEWPDVPLLEYLARTASGLYALIGGLALAMSFDVIRYRPLIRLLGWVSLPAGGYLFALGLYLGLPWWWVAMEGPVVVLTAVPLLVLSRPQREAPRGRG